MAPWMVDTGDLRSQLRRVLAPCLGQLGESLHCIAEAVLGEEDGVIDWVAAGPEGRAFVVLVAEGSGDAALLEMGLVQRSWVQARIADWRKLAPDLVLRAELAPRVLLIARDFARSTRIAAREAATASGEIWLARWNAAPGSGRIEITRIELARAPVREMESEPASTRATSRFRTGLRDADFANGNAT
jgi:hypothetical protein